LLDKEILPFVIKPGRYVGNELNSVHKKHESGMLKIALAFPEMYEIGMSYMGMQILYNIINKRPDALAERSFTVWPDMEDLMRKKNVPLFAVESGTPLGEFDIIGFHLTYEMTYATAVNMLDLAGIPVLAKERTEKDPLILAGGSSVMNPEPMADFIDLFFIGDAEEAIHEIIDAVKNSKAQGVSREETLLGLARIPGAYAPAFYRAVYDDAGRFRSLEKTHPMVSKTIKARSVAELKSEYYPEKPVVPFIETAHDHLSIEIMRGCVRGCRFCQAGYQYRPRRQRPYSEVASHLFSSLKATGYDDVTLLSLSSTDYDHLKDLLEIVSPRLTELRIGLALPSLRPETISTPILELLSSGRKTGLTLAPEAGTERLRYTLGKRISEADIFGAIEKALLSGWQTFKLYFMIGLPSETDDDIEGLISLLKRLSIMLKQGKGRNINVALSPFNPKSHTPWQWEPLANMSRLHQITDMIDRGVRKHNINIRHRNFDLSYFEGVLGRGDRRLGCVILNAQKNGARLDGWSEWFDPQRWREAFAQAQIDPDHYAGAIDEEAPLPWDHIEKGVSKDYLRDDNRKSREGIPPPSVFDRKKDESSDSQIAGADNFGRKPRRLARESSPPGTYKLRIRYGRRAQLRFLSHLDTIRTLYRAFKRAELPLAYSEGYHPHIKVSFGPPLPLGYTSDAEYLDLQLSQPFREEFIVRLRETLPDDLFIIEHKQYFASVNSLSKQLNLARYRIPRIEDMEFDSELIETVARDKILQVSRMKDGIEKKIEAGRFLQNLTLTNDELEIDVWQIPEGHIKPEEILIFGLGFDMMRVKTLTIHRANQFQKTGMRLIEPMELV
jgi:radical SAM family uncharacterized protein/radical SAM-linked protein